MISKLNAVPHTLRVHLFFLLNSYYQKTETASHNSPAFFRSFASCQRYIPLLIPSPSPVDCPSVCPPSDVRLFSPLSPPLCQVPSTALLEARALFRDIPRPLATRNKGPTMGPRRDLQPYLPLPPSSFSFSLSLLLLSLHRFSLSLSLSPRASAQSWSFDPLGKAGG